MITVKKQDNEMKARSQFTAIMMRLRKNKLAMLGLAILLFMAALALCADFIADYDTQVVGQDMGATILIIASLSFMGLGVKPPASEWGTMLYEGRDFLRQAPYLVLIPGTAITLAVISLNLLGDGLRDALDPRMKN